MAGLRRQQIRQDLRAVLDRGRIPLLGDADRFRAHQKAVGMVPGVWIALPVVGGGGRRRCVLEAAVDEEFRPEALLDVLEHEFREVPV